MRFFGSSYRDLPRFVLRRVDHVAAEVNGFLVVVVIALALLDLLCVVRKLADLLPPMGSQISAYGG